MPTHDTPTKENKFSSVANDSSFIGSDKMISSRFVDNRPNTNNQQSIHQLANGSQQVNQLKSNQELANNSDQSKEALQLHSLANGNGGDAPSPPSQNDTGLPDNLKTGIENLSGYSLDDVKVHRNSNKPTQLQAHAYAQGSDIHLGPGQEKHLPHEAWHVVQQKQGRVKPTMQMKGKVNVNDDAGLEKEADVMGTKALNSNTASSQNLDVGISNKKSPIQQKPNITIQRVRDELHAYEIGFTQASVGSTFTDVPDGVHKRLAKLQASSAEIDKGENLPEWIKGLRVFSIRSPEGMERIFSLDNRRLKVIKGSNIGNQELIPVQWASFNQVISECFKFTNRNVWEEAKITDQPTQEQRSIAPEGNLLGDFFAALFQAGYITAEGELTGNGNGNIEGDWNFNQAE